MEAVRCALACLAALMLAGCNIDSIGVKVTFRDRPGSTLDLSAPVQDTCLAQAGYYADRRRAC